MRALGPPSPSGDSPRLRGSAAVGARPGRQRRGLCRPLLSPAYTALRGALGASLPAQPPRCFWERAEGHGLTGRSGPPGGGALRSSSPTSRRAKPTGEHRGSPRLPGPGPAQPTATGGRSREAGRFPPPPGICYFFFRWEREVAVAAGAAGDGGRGRVVPSREGSRVPPRGLGSIRPRRPLSSPRARFLRGCGRGGTLGAHPPTPACGRHRPHKEKFYLPLPDLRFIKNKRKTFPSAGFRCVGEAAAAGTAEPRCPPTPPPPARGRALPGPRAPSPAGGGRREGGSFSGKDESGSYGKKDSAFIENLIYDSVL